MTHANIRSTGVYDIAPLTQLPREEWTFVTKDDHPDSVPAIVSDTIYFGTWDGTLHALDTSTGSELWIFHTGEGSIKSPSVAGDTVYVSSTDETLYALDSKTGAKRWRFTIRDYSEPFAIFSDPVVDGGVVYIGCTRDAFFALDAATGQVIWRIDASGWVSAPALADGTLYFGGRTLDGRDPTFMYAVDQASGHEKWRVPIQQNGLQDTPVVVDGMVFASTWRDGLLALDAATGHEKWRYTTGSALLTSPAVAYNTVYITDEGKLTALDIATGQQKWSLGDGGFTTTAPVIAGNVVYFASTSLGPAIPFVTEPDSGGYIYAVDAQTGQQLWRYKVNGLIYYSPVISDGILYYGDDEGYFHAIR